MYVVSALPLEVLWCSNRSSWGIGNLVLRRHNQASFMTGTVNSQRIHGLQRRRLHQGQRCVPLPHEPLGDEALNAMLRRQISIRSASPDLLPPLHPALPRLLRPRRASPFPQAPTLLPLVRRSPITSGGPPPARSSLLRRTLAIFPESKTPRSSTTMTTGTSLLPPRSPGIGECSTPISLTGRWRAHLSSST